MTERRPRRRDEVITRLVGRLSHALFDACSKMPSTERRAVAEQIHVWITFHVPKVFGAVGVEIPIPNVITIQEAGLLRDMERVFRRHGVGAGALRKPPRKEGTR
jgi:hypothetical protein